MASFLRNLEYIMNLLKLNNFLFHKLLTYIQYNYWAYVVYYKGEFTLICFYYCDKIITDDIILFSLIVRKPLPKSYNYYANRQQFSSLILNIIFDLVINKNNN